ncbi:STAS domain-containing protein [Actinoplanes sp. CA-252034]|uniref:STAS domain-containing protein n=1 Tax=Actinoplanes sp. CA-252034 TaxID=3239906 RepID=UPI003D9610D6
MPNLEEITMRLSVKERSATRRRPPRRVIVATGRIEIGDLEELEKQFTLSGPCTDAIDVELDLRGVTFLDAAVVAMVLHAHFALRQRGARFQVTHHSGQPHHYLQTCGALDLPSAQPTCRDRAAVSPASKRNSRQAA